MTVFINPGSHIPAENNVGWTNTHETAQRHAATWLHEMTEAGFTDIEVTDTGVESDGRWRFEFRHKVTGRMIALDTHGIDDLDAYLKQNVFHPRVYWGGSSSGNPSLGDFVAEGFEPVITYRRIGGAA